MSFPISRPRTSRPAPMWWMTAMALVAILLTGCAATSEPSSTTSVEATPEMTAAASGAPSPAPSESAAATIAADADLAALLPTTLGGCSGVGRAV